MQTLWAISYICKPCYSLSDRNEYNQGWVSIWWKQVLPTFWTATSVSDIFNIWIHRHLLWFDLACSCSVILWSLFATIASEHCLFTSRWVIVVWVLCLHCLLLVWLIVALVLLLSILLLLPNNSNAFGWGGGRRLSFNDNYALFSFQQRVMDNCLWYKLWVKLEIQLFSLFLLISSGTIEIFITLLLFLFALVITFISGFVLKLIRLFLVAYIHWETVEKYNLCDRLLWHIFMWEHFLKTTPERWKYSNSCG